ncbi:MAG: ArgE/DapE family deacylase [Thermoplasmata archaeon]
MDNLEELALLLIREKSENPPGNEEGVADLIKSKLKNYLPYKEIRTGDRRINLIFGQGKKIVFNGHMDTVPVGKNWTHNPDGEILNGKIYGRGASDMKGAIASLIIAIEEIVDEGQKDKLNNFKFAFVADEEEGGYLGTRKILDELDAKYGVVMEGSVFNGSICYRPGIRGTLWLELISKGRSAHASDPELGENAVMNLAELLIALKNIKLNFKKHAFLPDPTIALGTTFHGGEKVNIIPDTAISTIDIRTIPSMKSDEVIMKIKNEIKKIGKEIDVNIIHEVPPAEIPLDSWIISLVKKATFDTIGKYPELRGGKGSNDANYMIFKGIETVVFGPGDFSSDRAHGNDEHIPIERLIKFKYLYRRMLEYA